MLKLLIFTEEDHIPFVEGSPIISKFGPISRSVKSAVHGASTQSVEVLAAEVIGILFISLFVCLCLCLSVSKNVSEGWSL